MAHKTANVIARVEPEIKEQAEAILAKLGIPTSVVINLLYKQIVLTRSIPFSLALPPILPVREEMDQESFNQLMHEGLKQAQQNQSKPVNEVFDALKAGL